MLPMERFGKNEIHRQHVVRFDSINFSVCRECKLFESTGWLWGRALFVLGGNMVVTQIPSYNILKMQRKGL